MSSYVFDEVHLLEMASLRVKTGVTATLTIKRLVSDGTGLLHAHSGHTHSVEYEEREWAALTARVNFIVDSGGDLQVGQWEAVKETGEREKGEGEVLKTRKRHQQ